MALHTYKNLNKTLPTSIIIYRDGVGDGQISDVHKIEVAGIKVNKWIFGFKNYIVCKYQLECI